MGSSLPELERDLVALLGRAWVRREPRDLMAYAYDATCEKHMPDVVAFPASTAEVAGCVKLARRYNLPVVPRGAGTNVSGGTLPIQGGMVINMVRMNRVRQIDPSARIAVAEAGMTNLALQKALAPHGFFFAPDPSSMKSSTVGGNLAENAGGPRCAKYGVTANHVLGAEIVLHDGSVIEVGAGLGGTEEAPGLDLLSLVVGAEGTMGVVTAAAVRLTPLPRGYRTMLAVFGGVEEAMRAASGIVSARIVPAALEYIDRPCLNVIRHSRPGAFPEDAGAVLLIEVDGDPEDLDREVERIRAVVEGYGAIELRVARDEAEREALWFARRATYGALARVAPYIWSMDVTVPRDKLVPMLAEMVRLEAEYRLPIMTVAHAGDGNMHPTIPWNPKDPDESQRLRLLDRAIQTACVTMGGSITGEHGVGVEKLPGMAVQYTSDQLQRMQAVRRAFDPDIKMNPGKAVPAPAGGW